MSLYTPAPSPYVPSLSKPHILHFAHILGTCLSLGPPLPLVGMGRVPAIAGRDCLLLLLQVALESSSSSYRCIVALALSTYRELQSYRALSRDLQRESSIASIHTAYLSVIL